MPDESALTEAEVVDVGGQSHTLQSKCARPAAYRTVVSHVPQVAIDGLLSPDDERDHSLASTGTDFSASPDGVIDSQRWCAVLKYTDAPNTNIVIDRAVALGLARSVFEQLRLEHSEQRLPVS